MKAIDSEGREVQVGDVVSYPHHRGGRAQDRVDSIWCGNQVQLGHGRVVDAGTCRLGLSKEFDLERDRAALIDASLNDE